MALNDREKFVMHLITVMTLSSLGDPIDISLVQKEIRKNRCRKLTDKDVSEIWEDMKEEILNGKAVYEEMIAKLGINNNMFKVFKEDDGR
jgi:hypothetical protein